MEALQIKVSFALEPERVSLGTPFICSLRLPSDSVLCSLSWRLCPLAQQACPSTCHTAWYLPLPQGTASSYTTLRLKPFQNIYKMTRVDLCLELPMYVNSDCVNRSGHSLHGRHAKRVRLKHCMHPIFSLKRSCRSWLQGRGVKADLCRA